MVVSEVGSSVMGAIPDWDPLVTTRGTAAAPSTARASRGSLTVRSLPTTDTGGVGHDHDHGHETGNGAGAGDDREGTTTFRRGATGAFAKAFRHVLDVQQESS
jgi:hypothetical protein